MHAQVYLTVVGLLESIHTWHWLSCENVPLVNEHAQTNEKQIQVALQKSAYFYVGTSNDIINLLYCLNKVTSACISGKALLVKYSTFFISLKDKISSFYFF